VSGFSRTDLRLTVSVVSGFSRTDLRLTVSVVSGFSRTDLRLTVHTTASETALIITLATNGATAFLRLSRDSAT